MFNYSFIFMTKHLSHQLKSIVFTHFFLHRDPEAFRTGKRRISMKKTYKIDVDCANCAEKMQTAAKNTAGVKDAVVSFMTLKMKVEFEEGANPDAVMQAVRANCKKVEEDCEVFL